MKNIDWFQSLNRPEFAPPDWIFAPMWIFLYITIAISLIFFYKGGITKEKRLPLLYFFIQLFLNIIWSPTFFGNMNIKGGLIIVILLLLTLSLTIISFYKYSKTSAFILLPYFLWVCFATYLNYQYFKLN